MALAAIERIVDAGAVAAVGHTEATYAQARAAIDAGATVATHLFNAMRPIHHREPGPVLALMEDPRVTVELITDGVHLHPALYRDVAAERRTGPGRRWSPTRWPRPGWPTAPTGSGPLAVDVVDGVARVAGTRHHRGQHRDDGPRLPVRRREQRAPPRRRAAGRAQSSMNPARALGLPSPALIAGGPADLAVLDREFAVVDVMRSGSWA